MRDKLDKRKRTLGHPFKGEDAYARKECWEDFEQQSERAARDVQKYLRAQARRLLAPVDEALGKRTEAAQRRLSQAEKSVQARRKRLTAAEEHVRTIRRDRSLFDKRMRQTVAYAKRYDEHMNASYRTELARRHLELRESPGEGRLVSALYLLSVADTAHRLEVTQ